MFAFSTAAALRPRQAERQSGASPSPVASVTGHVVCRACPAPEPEPPSKRRGPQSRIFPNRNTCLPWNPDMWFQLRSQFVYLFVVGTFDKRVSVFLAQPSPDIALIRSLFWSTRLHMRSSDVTSGDLRSAFALGSCNCASERSASCNHAPKSLAPISQLSVKVAL